MSHITAHRNTLGRVQKWLGLFLKKTIKNKDILTFNILSQYFLHKNSLVLLKILDDK